MRTMLRALSVAAAMTAAAASLPAQTQLIAGGHTTVSTSSFLSYVASFGVAVTNLSGTSALSSATTLPVTEGALDLRTGAGQIITNGGYIFRGNGNTVRVVDLVLDSTNPSSPAVTALFIVNDRLVGRAPLYQVAVPSSVTLPLTPGGNVEQLSGLGLTLTQPAANIFNAALIITEPVLQAGESAGTAGISVSLTPQ